MPQIQLNSVTIGFRGPPLLDEVNCVIEPGDRIGLLGRNGAGKTTLMKMLSGQLTPDHGDVVAAPGTRVAQLRQDVPQDIQSDIAGVVRQGLPDKMEQWEADHAVEKTLTRMGLDADARFEGLSSGMKRRVLLAQAIVGEPDMLLLDEPTNHLDIDAINWLEQFLSGWRATLLFVTHDREFLRRLATRILEIDRGQLFDWSCDYDTFLQRKEQALAAEEKQNALFDKRLAEEEKWIRQGIKARRTRNEGRVRALKKMRVERSQRREKLGTSRLAIQEAGRSGALVADAKDVAFRYKTDGGDHPVFEGLTTTLMRGDKVGVIGPNGAGKTTLLRTLLGELEPSEGTVRLGTNLELAYFDQLRGQLDPEKTVQENIGDGYDTINVALPDGKQSARHIIGYLQDFLFTPDRARTPVKLLSGGERNRVLLAKLFSKPANIIVLDEPTNDLDAETLELLEEKLIEFSGTLLVVSHDRAFLNNVVTSTLVFEPEGVKEYDGGYDDWLRQRKAAEPPPAAEEKPKPAEKPPAKADAGKKLSYNEQRELKSLPGLIEKLEGSIAALHEEMADPAFYQQEAKVIRQKQAEEAEQQQQLAEAYERWESLES